MSKNEGNGHLWAAVIVLAAIVCAPAYFLGVRTYLHLKLESTRELDRQADEEEEEDGQDANRLLFIHAVFCLASGFLVAVLNVACSVRSSTLQQKSRNGLTEAIENYGSDVVAKARVDAVQAELECCGDDSYEDWFRVPWMRPSVEGSEEEEEGPRLEGQWV